MNKITSVTNKNIKKISKLMTSSKYRVQLGMFVLEGLRLCFDILNSDYELCELYVTSNTLDKHGEKVEKLINKAKKSFIITDEICKKISDTKTSQGIFCICKILDKQNDIYKIDINGKYILLEQLSDPTNIGAISRTAEALGVNGVILAGGCDIYSPKVLRASMGSLLRIPVIEINDIDKFISYCKEKNVKTYATTPRKSATDITRADMTGSVVCVVGNEAKGVKQKTMEACDDCVTIKMQGRAESLNAAIAASITIWEMMKNE